jgi:hypothetical protein
MKGNVLMVIIPFVLWMSMMIAVALTAIGIGYTIAEVQGKLQIRQTVRNVGACLKYEVVELPVMEQEVTTGPVFVALYRVMKTRDEYLCPLCKCPATCARNYQSLDPHQQHGPRLYEYTCIAGHTYRLRFSYDLWKGYIRKDQQAYVLVQKKTAFLS